MSPGAGTAGRIFFTEVGPRDGLQNLPVELPTQIKLELLEGLLETGVDLVEATSFVSPTWVPKLADAEEVLRQLVTGWGPDVLSRIRVLVPNRRGLARALAASARRVVVNVGATDGFNRRNLNRSVSETMTEIAAVAKEAAKSKCLWDASLSVAFGCPYDGRVAPERVVTLACELAAMGAFEISVADTIGVADPEAVSRLINLLAKELPLDRVSLHLHDTRGMGLANVLAGYQAGVTRFEGSVGGIGGCPFAPRSTGNVCSEDLLYMLKHMGASVPIDVGGLCQVAEKLQGILGHELPGRLYRAGPWDPDGFGATAGQPS